MRKVITKELKEQIIRDYLSKVTKFQELVDKYNLSLVTINRILKDVPKYSKHLLYNPNLDETYFNEIDCDTKGYYLGLLISDGNIYDPVTHNQHQVQKWVSITLDLEDEYLLENFLKDVKSNRKVGHDGRGCGQACVASNKIAEALSSYGIVPNKTLITYFPKNVNKKYWHSIVRGVFDGDGNIYLKRTKRRYHHCLSFCGTHQLMIDLQEIISTELNLQTVPKVYDYKDRNLSELKFSTIHDIKLIGDWMYQDSERFLTRKRNKYQEFLEYYNL